MWWCVCGVEWNELKKGEYFSWSCHLDYKQTLSRDSNNRDNVLDFFQSWLHTAIGYFALYLCVVLTCRQGCD